VLTGSGGGFEYVVAAAPLAALLAIAQVTTG
jgi:hypothetical protein